MFVTGTYSPRSTLSHLSPHFGSPACNKKPARSFRHANVSMDSRSEKDAFLGSRIHAASTEKGLPTTHFAVGLPRPASHTLDDSLVTLLAQYIAENFTCPLPHHCSIHSAYEAVHRLGFSLALRSTFWACPTPFPRACACQAVSKKAFTPSPPLANN